MTSPGPHKYLHAATHLVLKTTCVCNISETGIPWNSSNCVLLSCFRLLLGQSSVLFQLLISSVSSADVRSRRWKGHAPSDRGDDNSTERSSNMSQVTECKIAVIPTTTVCNHNDDGCDFSLSCHLCANSSSCVPTQSEQPHPGGAVSNTAPQRTGPKPQEVKCTDKDHTQEAVSDRTHNVHAGGLTQPSRKMPATVSFNPQMSNKSTRTCSGDYYKEQSEPCRQAGTPGKSHHPPFTLGDPVASYRQEDPEVRHLHVNFLSGPFSTAQQFSKLVGARVAPPWCVCSHV